MKNFDRVQYARDYRQKNLKQVTVNLSRILESDMIEWLEKQTNRSSYVKELIRKDMEQKQKAE